MEIDDPSEFIVTNKDIESYLKYKCILNEKENFDDLLNSIVAIGPSSNQIGAYLINYSSGWELIASDKRAPVVLAKGPQSFFFIDDILGTPAEAPGLWMSALVEEVLLLPEFISQGLLDDEAIMQMNACFDFWTAISNPERVLLYSNPQTKLHEPPGHWELIGVTETIEVLDSIRLTTTKWGQNYPYNQFTPLKQDGDTLRAPAGCVAVAGAQMLYYLHEHHGVPVSVPSSGHANCTIYTVNPYLFYQDNPSSTCWNNMENLNNPERAVLIANAGNLVGTIYGANSSSAQTSDLRLGFFDHYGWECDYLAYSATQVSLNFSHTSNNPLVACSQGHMYLDGIQVGPLDGHSFLIDKAIRSRTKRTYMYQWIYDEPDPMGFDYGRKTEIEYGDTIFTDYIGMNWGNEGLYDDMWFSKTGAWMINEYEGYDHDRYVLTNFSVK